jgi:hypothetical protein
MIREAHDCLAERRKRLRQQNNVFGLDFVDVCSQAGPVGGPRTIRLHFLGRVPAWLASEFIVLCRDGSDRRLQVELTAAPTEATSAVSIEVLDAVCDGVLYHLTIATPAESASELDPFFTHVTFRFDPHAPAEADCREQRLAESRVSKSPEISYLAKDYATFRQLLLDRMAVTMPQWRDRCPADIGIMLVEVLAYAADHLSYYQDAVATEAYLGTARLRPSLRRHARLVDYRIHEGCNARAWIHVQVSADVSVPAKDLFFVSHPTKGSLSTESLEKILRNPRGRCEVYEPVVSKRFSLWESHNLCRIHDWGGAQVCLPQGTTSVFLVNQQSRAVSAGRTRHDQGGGPQPRAAQKAEPVDAGQVDAEQIDAEQVETGGLHFQVGDVVLLEEILSPWTGSPDDADPSRRHVVRLTRVEYEYDVVQHDGTTVTVPHRDALLDVPLVKISWDAADALPFAMWIRRPPGADWQPHATSLITVARGNMLLADHGLSVHDDPIDLRASHDPPPQSMQRHYPAARIVATLPRRNLTFSDQLPESGAAAAFQIRQDPRRAVPQLVLRARSDERNLARHFSLLELRDVRRIARRLLDRLWSGDGDQVVPPLRQTIHRVVQTQSQLGLSAPSRNPALLADLQVLRKALRDDLQGTWQAQYDLLNSGPNDPHFAVEMTDDRQAQLRFGQLGFGETPRLDEDPARAEMLADYRVGNGTAGNLPAESAGGRRRPRSGIAPGDSLVCAPRDSQ